MPKRAALLSFEVATAKALASGIVTAEFLSGRVTDLADGLVDDDVAKKLTKKEQKELKRGVV